MASVRVTGAVCLVMLWGIALPAAAAGPLVLDLQPVSALGLDPDPIDLPNPILPNPLHEALVASAPATAPVPVAVEDAPDGLYVQPEGGAPIRLVGYPQGVAETRIAPVEAVAALLPLGEDLPVNVGGCGCVPAAGLTLTGTFAAPLAPDHAGDAGAGGDPGLPVPLHEARPVGPSLEAGTRTPAPYQPQLAQPLQASAAAAPQAPGAVDLGAEETLLAALAAGAAVLLLKLLAPLYHRFKRKTALDNPTRQKVYELLRAAPGASAAELGEKSGLHVTTVKYHLDVLRRVGMVGEQTVDGRRRFYSYENGDRMEMLSRALLDEPAARAVYQQIAQQPGRPFIEVAKALGMRKEHVHYHVQKLARHGLITDKWEAGRRLLFPAPPAQGHDPDREAKA